MSDASERVSKAERIFRETMGLSADALIDSLTKESHAAWDSLRHAELVIRLQKELSIRFSIEEIQALSSVSALCEIVRKKV